jgi:hypothetical protein
MALTRSFKETVKARAERDPEFRAGILEEAIEALLRSELDVGEAPASRLCQCHDWLRSLGQGNSQKSQEPDANAQRRRKSACRQPVLRHRALAEE